MEFHDEENVMLREGEVCRMDHLFLKEMPSHAVMLALDVKPLPKLYITPIGVACQAFFMLHEK